jgi:hypothetical protein
MSRDQWAATRRFNAALSYDPATRWSLREHAVPLDAWILPTRVLLVDSTLTWSRGRQLVSSAPATLLRSFLRLSDAEPKSTRDFVRRFGTLELCERHRFPRTHEEGCWPRERDKVFEEDVDGYRALARTMDRLVGIAERLLDPVSEVAPRELWEAVLQPIPVGVAASPEVSAAFLYNLGKGLQGERDWLGMIINHLIRKARIAPSYRWVSGARPALGMWPSSLFGALVLRLATTISTQAFRRCKHCGASFPLPVRRGRPPKYCPVCRAERAGQKRADLKRAKRGRSTSPHRR